MKQTDRADARLAEFEALYERSHQRAYRLALRLTHNVTDAEDLTQEAFVRAWQSFPRYDRARPFETWLLRILSRLAIDQWRRTTAASFSLDEDNVARGSRASSGCWMQDCAPSPEQQCVVNVLGERLQVALGRLPSTYRTAIVLADIEARSYEEVAQRMRCPVGTVRSRLHRGHIRLRKWLRSPAYALNE